MHLTVAYRILCLSISFVKYKIKSSTHFDSQPHRIFIKMGDNSDDELAFDWVPYSERKDWADVRPLAQDDGDKPIVQIAYSDKCKFLS